MLSAQDEQHAQEKFGEPQSYRIPRVGERDLGFSGWEIAKSEGDYSSVHLTVTIYVTTKGSYVTKIERVSKFNIIPKPEPDIKAAAHTYPPFALQWLVEDNGNSLGATSKAAWELACRNWPELAEHEMETV